MLLNHFCVAVLLKSTHVAGIITITGDKHLTWLFMFLNLISFVFKKINKCIFLSGAGKKRLAVHLFSWA